MIIRHIDPWSDIQLTPLADGSGWLTLKSFRCQFQADQDYFLTIPVGFKTDLASIPAMFRIMFRTWSWWTRAALVHDCLYHYGQGTKEMADDLFEAVLRLDEPEVVEDGHQDDVTAMATAVRLGGVGNFDNPLIEVVLSTEGYPL